MLEVPRSANGRGLREAGCAEGTGPGLSEAPAGRSAAEIRDALESGELNGLILWDVDPVRDFDDPEGWTRALSAADFVLASSGFDNASVKAADVHFPGETFAEKEGTVTHPDGRLQRVRPSVPHPGAVRPLWQALTELSALLGDETGAGTSPEVFDLLTEDAPFLKGIGIDDIGGTGLRWPELVMEQGAWSQDSASGERRAESGNGNGAGSGGREPGDGEIRLGTYRDLWSDYVAERNPALRFLSPAQTLELNPADAERLGVAQGQRVQVGSNGHSVIASVALRERMGRGTGFLIEGVAENGANRLAGERIVTVAPAPEEPVEEPAYGSASREAVSWG
jgi:NADH-quinone oxidoreductase subunit G